MLESVPRNDGQVIVGWNTFITEETPCLASFLKQAGYRTAFVGKNHVIHATGMEIPEWKSDPVKPEVKALLERNYQRQKEAVYQAGFDYAASLYYNNPGRNGVQALNSHNLDWIASGAIEFLKDHQKNNNEQPFFMWLATTVPHGPGGPEKSWKADRRITSKGLLDQPLDLLSSPQVLTERLQKSGITPDWGHENMLWLDDLFGAVIDQLRETGELENTIIVFFNDHGQLAKGTLYQGGVHGESFIWRSGGFPTGSESDMSVSNVDFAPTLLELAGVPVPERQFDGKSFVPVLMGNKEEPHLSLYFEIGFTRAVIKGDWKYIGLRYPDHIQNASKEKRQKWLDRNNRINQQRGMENWNTDPMAPFSHVQAIPGGGDAERRSMSKYPAYSERDQLYDLKSDPNEQNNLAEDFEHREKLKEMQQELKKHLQNLPGGFAEFKSDGDSI
jgi:arylsulfatase A-like enzyme